MTRPGPILLLALVLRVAWVLLSPNEPTSDQVIYHQAAVDLAEGHGYVDEEGNPANWWPVGYPALVSVAYRVFGSDVSAAFGLNVLLGLLAVLGVWRLGNELYGARAGAAAALLFALYPTLILYTTIVAAENAFLAGLVWLVWLLVRAADHRRSIGWAIAAGLLLGALSYVRPTALPMPVVLGWLAWRRGAGLPFAIVRTTVVVLVAVTLLLPWGLRNQSAFGKFMPISDNGGSNLWMGNHEGGTGGYAPLPSEVMGLSLPEREALLRDRAVTFIREHPGVYLELCVRRVGLTLASDTIAAVWNEPGMARRFGDPDSGEDRLGGIMHGLKVVCTGAHWLALLAAAAALVCRPWRRADGALLLVLALLAVPFVLIVGGNRYHLPWIPFTLVLAGSLWRAARPETAPGAATDGAPAASARDEARVGGGVVR